MSSAAISRPADAPPNRQEPITLLVTAVAFPDIVLAIHIMSVVLAFGIVVAWPLVSQTVERVDPRAVPMIFRVRVLLGRTLVNPGLLLVVAAGIYLASDLHLWKQFYVMWGLGAAIVLGALEGAVAMRQSRKLAELAASDIESAGSGSVSWSEEFITRRGRADMVSMLMAVLVLATVYVMTVK
jgi:hypothetical protein